MDSLPFTVCELNTSKSHSNLQSVMNLYKYVVKAFAVKAG